jgi:cathepsin L
MKTASAVVGAILASSASAFLLTSCDDLATMEYRYTFEDFKAEYGKAYAAADEPNRKAAFDSNLRTIREHNADVSQTFKMGLNDFADLTAAEFKAQFTSGIRKGPLAPPLEDALTDGAGAGSAALPESIDWRAKSVVTAVKNQGGCGSCWAFSATETLESHVAIASGKLLTLSEQQVVSCSPNPDHCGGTGGCKGSTQPLAFNYTMTAGATTEADYPYKSKLGINPKCKPDMIKPVAGNSGFVSLPSNNYTALISAVANLGPIAISAAAGPWQLYEKGVFSKKCSWSMDHGIQLVGYGTDSSAGSGDGMYWLVRNSWGATWGEKGYIRLERNGEGKEPCGMDTTPTDGDACGGNKTAVQYCGECAIMSSSAYPTGAHLIN